MKSAFVSIIGRPSVGKSTLMNALCGQKIAITSDVPQTTRNKIRGILSEESGQLVFLDTPGFHRSQKKINNAMRELVKGALKDSDLVLYVLDAGRLPGDEEEEIVSLLRGYRERLVIGVNKGDLKPNRLAEIKGFLENRLPDPVLQVFSATAETGLDELKRVLYDKAPEGEALYPEDFYTDQDPEFRIQEIIREKAFQLVRQEVPHSLYVEIADMEVRPSGTEKEDQLWVRAFLNVERESQKGILVGKGGSTVKEIRVKSQKEMQRLLPYRIHLDLRIKVSHKWRNRDNILKKYIN